MGAVGAGLDQGSLPLQDGMAGQRPEHELAQQGGRLGHAATDRGGRGEDEGKYEAQDGDQSPAVAQGRLGLTESSAEMAPQSQVTTIGADRRYGCPLRGRVSVSSWAGTCTRPSHTALKLKLLVNPSNSSEADQGARIGK